VTNDRRLFHTCVSIYGMISRQKLWTNEFGKIGSVRNLHGLTFGRLVGSSQG
jgi:hypothetical protein